MHEKMYADDAMLMLGDSTTFLQEAISTITEFGSYSVLTINWSTSALMLLDSDSA